jgi:hypothetical protein
VTTDDLEPSGAASDANDDSRAEGSSAPTPKSLVEILGGLWRPKARSESDPRSTRDVINGLESRERMYGAILAALELALTLGLYFGWRHNKKVDLRNLAPDVLIVGLIGVALMTLGVGLRRRALLGFAAILVGLALLSFGQIYALIYLVFGGWLIMRVMRKGQKKAPAGSRPARARPAGGTARNAPAAPRAPGASKRYTPPRRVGSPAKGR